MKQRDIAVERPAEQIPLGRLASELHQGRKLILILDAFTRRLAGGLCVA